MLRVGAGKANIDPYDDMYPMATHFGICDGKYNSCFCRAIVIDNNKRQLVIVAYELSDRPKIDNLNEKIAEETGCSPQDIIIVMTHNHSSPCDENINEIPEEIHERCERYKEIELMGGIEAVKMALASLRVARIGFGTTDSFINANRDLKTLNGYWVEAPNMDGNSDKTLSMVKFVDDKGKLIAAILNHCTHAVFTYLECDTDGKKKLSGNFPGITCDFLEKYYGNNSVVMWTSGAAGDQDPYILPFFQMDYPDGYTTRIQAASGTGYQMMEYIGRMHAVDAIHGINSITTYSDDIEIKHVVENTKLPRQITEGNDTGNRIYRMGGNGVRRSGDKALPLNVPKRYEDKEHPVEVRMELVILGDIAIILAGAELYCHIGQEMKAVSPYKNTFVVTHCYYHIGYVLDKDSENHLVFQAFNEIIPGKSEPMILACENKMFKRLFQKSKRSI